MYKQIHSLQTSITLNSKYYDKITIMSMILSIQRAYVSKKKLYLNRLNERLFNFHILYIFLYTNTAVNVNIFSLSTCQFMYI